MMAGRYLATGTQLGMLISLCKTDTNKCNDEINKIIENQFVGNSTNDIKDDVVEVMKNGFKRKG